MPSGRHNQAGLANPRRALEQKQRTAPGDRVTQTLIDPGENGLPLEKRLPIIHRVPRRRSYPRQNSSVHPRKSRWSPTARQRSGPRDPGCTNEGTEDLAESAPAGPP